MLFYTMNPAHKQGSIAQEMKEEEMKDELVDCKEEDPDEWDEDDHGLCYCT